jgi:hypothetical protein
MTIIYRGSIRASFNPKSVIVSLFLIMLCKKKTEYTENQKGEAKHKKEKMNQSG